MEWTLDWTSPGLLKIENPGGRRGDVLVQGCRLETKCQVGMRRGQLRAHSLIYRFGGATFALKPESKGATKFRLIGK